MPTDLLQVIEKHKDLLTAENYQSIRDSYEVMPEELKETIATQLENAAYLQSMITEYEDQRIQALEEASKQLTIVKDGYVKTYKNTVLQIESEEKASDDSNAENMLQNL